MCMHIYIYINVTFKSMIKLRQQADLALVCHQISAVLCTNLHKCTYIPDFFFKVTYIPDLDLECVYKYIYIERFFSTCIYIEIDNLGDGHVCAWWIFFFYILIRWVICLSTFFTCDVLGESRFASLLPLGSMLTVKVFTLTLETCTVMKKPR